MSQNSRDSNTALLLFFIALSLGAHLLLLFLGPDSTHKEKLADDEPTYVEIQPMREERETAKVLQPTEKEVETHRLGEANQEVEREQAPEGYDLEDSAPSTPQIEAQEKPDTEETKPEEIQEQPQEQEQPEVAEPEPEPEPEVDTKPREQQEEAREAQPEPEVKPMPNLERLLQSSNHAAADIARETRVKHRPDVARGEAVWLNMKHDLLFSFFSRFKKGIYGVWNYPHESAQRGEQGTALLEIIINRDGSVNDVNLLNGTEFERLNREAIAAVFKAGPYGKLPASYPEEQLRIKAYFHYQLGGGKRIFGK
ncbi:MAG: energy transducer TonB [Desulfuromonadaceae bacterium]|nr:TonB family protein [Geobacteraceae bacterium]